MEMQLFTEVGVSVEEGVMEDKPMWLDSCAQSSVESGKHQPVGVVQAPRVFKILVSSAD